MVIGVVLVVLSAASPATTLSVAEGNVYDIYGTNASGNSILIASCASFDTYLADANNPTFQANYPGGLSGIPDSSCGAIILNTSTVVQGTTFTNYGNPTISTTSIASGGCFNGYNCATTTQTTTTAQITTTITKSGTTTTATGVGVCMKSCPNTTSSLTTGTLFFPGIGLIVIGGVVWTADSKTKRRR